MNNTKISIIVPVYNARAHIKQCIYSLVNQTYKNIEIIFIDDGSIDDCSEIIEKFAKKDKRIILYKQKNSGVSAARNKGLQLAQGDYIMCCDADDFYERNAVEVCVSEVNKRKCCDAVFYNGRLICPDGSVSPAIVGEQYQNIPRNIDCEKSGFLGIFTTVWAGMLSRKVLEKYKISFREGHIYEDWEFLGHFMSKASKVAWVNVMLYNYRWNQATSISTDVSKTCLDIFETFDLIEHHYIQAGRWENVQYSHYQKALSHLIYFTRDRIKNASEAVRTAYTEKTKEYINRIPYIHLLSIMHYTPLRERVWVLEQHKDAADEVRFCKHNLFRSKIHQFKMQFRIKTKNIMMKIFPAYRVTNNLRQEIEQMHWTLISKIDHLTQLEQENKKEINRIKKHLQIGENPQSELEETDIDLFYDEF